MGGQGISMLNVRYMWLYGLYGRMLGTLEEKEKSYCCPDSV